jgi:RimJ/RimL family protein N-acetyltransferase
MALYCAKKILAKGIRTMLIRPPKKSDLAAISLVLADTELFPAEMLEEMIAPFFEDPTGSEKWLVHEHEAEGVIGFAYFRPEPLAEGTWNLLAIGLRKTHQGHGYGETMIKRVEQELSSERVLIVETSGVEDFEATRTFYERCGYDREAVIRDYWATGDDKIIYRKALGS